MCFLCFMLKYIILASKGEAIRSKQKPNCMKESNSKLLDFAQLLKKAEGQEGKAAKEGKIATRRQCPVSSSLIRHIPGSPDMDKLIPLLKQAGDCAGDRSRVHLA